MNEIILKDQKENFIQEKKLFKEINRGKKNNMEELTVNFHKEIGDSRLLLGKDFKNLTIF